MSIKVQIDNTTFYCDTAQEAILLHELAQPKTSVRAVATHKSYGIKLPGSDMSDDTKEAKAFLRKLMPNEGSELSAEEMAKILDTKPTGVGPRLSRMKRLLASMSPTLDIDDFVTRYAVSGGGSVWVVSEVPNV